MDSEWLIDCSPNTRSKKKREIEEEQAGRLIWKHDEGLRRFVLQQGEDTHIEPPTPTQKPRPVSSRLASSPSDPSSSSSTSSSRPSTSRPRKRACRQRGSLPSTSSTISSLPTPDRNSNGDRLDALLARFALGHADDDPTQMSPLRMMSSNITAPSPLRNTLSSTSIESGKTSVAFGNRSASSSRNDLGRSISSVSRDLQSSTSSSIFRDTSPVRSTSTTHTASTFKAPLSPSKPGAPRIGLRSSQSASNSNRRTDGNKLNKQFKPPLLASRPQVMPQPIRSSPRRHASSSVTRPHQAVQTPVKGIPKLCQLEKAKEPSSDGPATGDESIDSFDGLFAEGGPDIDELLKAVDGS